MKNRYFISLAIVFFVIWIVGCQSNSLNGSNTLSKPEEVALEESVGKPDDNLETNCSAINPHPVAEGMTETFEITYDEVMTLYCDGYAFSDILVALETSELVDQTPAALLARLRTRSWQEIWDEFGINSQN